MGFFDGLRRDKNTAETIKKKQEETPKQVDIEVKEIAPVQQVAEPSQYQPEVVERAPRAQKSAEHEVVHREIKSYAEKAPVTHVVGQTKIIAIINQKGGVGKTTTAVNLSAMVAELGCKTLVVDMDPQGNTTSGLGMEAPEKSIYEVLLGRADVKDCIEETEWRNLWIAGSDTRLAGA